MNYWKQSISVHSLSERNSEGIWYVSPCILRCLNCDSLTYFFVGLLFFSFTVHHIHFTFTVIALLNTTISLNNHHNSCQSAEVSFLASIIRGLDLVGGRWDTKEMTCKRSTVASSAAIYASTFTAKLSLFITKTFIIPLLKWPIKLKTLMLCSGPGVA